MSGRPWTVVESPRVYRGWSGVEKLVYVWRGAIGVCCCCAKMESLGEICCVGSDTFWSTNCASVVLCMSGEPT